MNKSTVQKINNINQKLYSNQSNQFSSTRGNSWQGWNLIKKYIFDDISVLDVACGNARFAEFLNQNLFNGFTYYGIDSSEELIQIARTKLKSHNIQLQIFDVLSNKLELNQKFDLITIFGFMHHIPSKAERVNFMSNISDLISEGGRIIFTTWNFNNLKLFEHRLNIDDLNRLEINSNELEENDYFLPWMDSTDIRYAHLYTESEIKELAEKCNLKIVDSFRADGKDKSTNTYYILTKF